MLNGLDLFSGIGGIALALEPWVRTIAYCENDRYAQSVLLSRMRDGSLPCAPIWDDVSTLRADHLCTPEIGIDIICGGFPCQDISVAGTGTGLDGERSGLFFEVVRLVGECRPRFVFLENVPALAVRGLDRVLLEFDALGYDARWTIVSAAEVGAPHLRERIWILAHANSTGLREQPDGQSERKGSRIAGIAGEEWQTPDAESKRRREGWTESESTRDAESRVSCGQMANASRAGLERWVDAEATWAAFRLGSGSGSGSEAWTSRIPKPSLCRGDDGLQNRVDRLRGLGNAVVPQAAREAFRRLIGLA